MGELRGLQPDWCKTPWLATEEDKIARRSEHAFPKDVSRTPKHGDQGTPRCRRDQSTLDEIYQVIYVYHKTSSKKRAQRPPAANSNMAFLHQFSQHRNHRIEFQPHRLRSATTHSPSRQWGPPCAILAASARAPGFNRSYCTNTWPKCADVCTLTLSSSLHAAGCLSWKFVPFSSAVLLSSFLLVVFCCF